MSRFIFHQHEWPAVFEAASRAEGAVHADPRTAGGFALLRRSMAKRVRAFLQAVEADLRLRSAWSPARQGRWLRRKVLGYFQYHGVPGNRAALETVRREDNRIWLAVLRKRSQKHALTWARFGGWVKRWIPSTRTIHPYPNQRFAF